MPAINAQTAVWAVLPSFGPKFGRFGNFENPKFQCFVLNMTLTKWLTFSEEVFVPMPLIKSIVSTLLCLDPNNPHDHVAFTFKTTAKMADICPKCPYRCHKCPNPGLFNSRRMAGNFGIIVRAGRKRGAFIFAQPYISPFLCKL